MSNLIARFAKNESGATAIEYGLIGGIMAVALLAMFAIFTPKMEAALTNIGDKMKTGKE
ncbi:Flp family type IVb pilin [Jiella pacifica]|uniref:Flp family type IVb pilin n=1 Tax=Jiella pacifica TaxID=2696469 RepID=A0A6N9SZ86_9HYPH|nr:Flp family type IVb pilin [Jiella pacifica]NDW04404.1 Flp family type IVb pilin [Jiella pacifica]